MSVQHYVLEKCGSHDAVFLGTTHRQPAILALISDLLPLLTQAGVTHLGLEIGSDQQHRIDAYLMGGGDPSQIALADAIECPQYRQLIQVLNIWENGPLTQYQFQYYPICRLTYVSKSLAATKLTAYV